MEDVFYLSIVGGMVISELMKTAIYLKRMAIIRITIINKSLLNLQ
jgi:hypothetical protein